MTTGQLHAQWELQTDEEVMTRLQLLKERLAVEEDLNDEEIVFYNYMTQREKKIKRDEKQKTFEQQKRKEAKHSVQIEVPDGYNTVSCCQEHGWFAGKIVYSRIYNGKEVKNINQASSIAHWGARCPQGCFIIGGGEKPMSTISELKTVRKSTVAVKRLDLSLK